MTKIIRHIRRWNIWRRKSLNSKLCKLLVLAGLIHSQTFALTLLPEEIFNFNRLKWEDEK